MLLLLDIKRSTSSGLRPICCHLMPPAMSLAITLMAFKFITISTIDLLLSVISLIKSLIGSPATSSDICALGIPLLIAPMFSMLVNI